MTRLRVLLSRALDLVFSRRREHRLDEEIRTHLEFLADQYMAAGMPRADAQRAAKRSFGGIEPMKEACRDQRGLPLVDALARDFGFALRLMRRDPGFSITAALVLGLGIGINNMLFTILNAHTIRGLPISDAARVLFISTVNDRGADRGVSFADFKDMQRSARHLAGIAAFRVDPLVVAGDERAPERLDGAYVSANAFALLDIRPLLGRGLLDADDEPGAAPVALLGRTAWETRYGRDPSILGRVISVNGAAATLVGIVPDRSGFPSSAVVWLPLAHAPAITTQPRDARTLQVFGRVRDSSTVEEASAEVAAIADRLAGEHPDTNQRVRARAIPINHRFIGRPSDPVWRAFMTVGFIVVFISCANVANLMLDRSTRRARELAIRASIGGSRGRLLRQLLAEGVALAAVGTGVGLLVAIGAIRIFRSAIPAGVLPYWFDYSMDWRVVAALVGVAAMTVLIFALVPAIRASKTDVIGVLKIGRSPSVARRHIWATGFLAAQVALAVVLLAQLAVVIRTRAPGLPSEAMLDTPEIITAAVTLPAATYPTATERAAFFDAVLERVRRIPAISSAAIASTLPYSGGESRPVVIDGEPPRDEKSERTSLAITISPDYFRTLGLPVLQGRELGDADGRPGQNTVIVNQAFVEEFFPDGSALGRRISLRPAPAGGAQAVPWFTIVGIAPAIGQRGNDSDSAAYLPLTSGVVASNALIVRSRADVASVVAALRQQVQAVDPIMPVFRARTLPHVRRDAEWNGRLSYQLLLFLTFIAVALATTGLYAVTAHGVSQERHEIGIRVALGARPRQVAARIVRRLMFQTLVGFGAGVVCTMLWYRTFPSGDAGVRATDPLSLTIVAAFLLTSVGLAAAIPARAAARIDPLTTIRSE